MAAVKVIFTAINLKNEKTDPLRVYLTVEGKKLPKQFVLKIEDAGVSENGTEQVRLKNDEFSLIVTNSTEYMDKKLAGFRRRLGEKVFILCEEYTPEILTVKSVSKPDEEF